MKTAFRATCAALLIAGAVPLASCTDQQVAQTNAKLDKYDHALDNWVAIKARYDQSIAKTDNIAKPYCNSATAVGDNVGRIVKNDDVALTALDTLRAAVDAYCLGPIQNAESAIVALSKAIADGQVAIQHHNGG